MIELNAYSIGTAVILGSAGVALYKNWKYGHDLAVLAKEHLTDEMRSLAMKFIAITMAGLIL